VPRRSPAAVGVVSAKTSGLSMPKPEFIDRFNPITDFD
jgi:hypothetical protein